MAKKPTKLEKKFRVNKVVRILKKSASPSSIVQLVADEWGPSERTVDKYIQEARAIIKKDADIDHHDYLASRLHMLVTIVQRAVKNGQLSNAIRPLKLQSEFLGLGHQK